MRNPTRIIEICDDTEHQRSFLKLSSRELRLDGRVESLGIAKALSNVSSKISKNDGGESVEHLLREAADAIGEDDVAELLGEELNRFSSSLLYAVPARTVDSDIFSGLVLFDDNVLRVSLVAAGPMAHRIKIHRRNSLGKQVGVTIQGTDSLVSFIRSGDAKLSLWSAEPFLHNDELCGRRMKRLPDKHIADGEAIFLEGGSKGMSIASCSSPILFVIVTRNTPRSPVNAHYELEGELHSCTASEMKSSRIQILATLVRELKCEDGVDALAQLLSHPDHFVRWQLLREITALCIDAALPHLLRAAKTDPHVQVRNAAKLTIEMIGEEYGNAT